MNLFLVNRISGNKSTFIYYFWPNILFLTLFCKGEEAKIKAQNRVKQTKGEFSLLLLNQSWRLITDLLMFSILKTKMIKFSWF